ncbi:DEAD/DEAH box helicase [Candidatus Poribacteria bacterium]|nr:DEAD/DEAH box helicase [Gammaproteobacteria bacterium]MYF99451.1 DEAD/DEAH box helicase [Candidatus Poribacteria bacterium]
MAFVLRRQPALSPKHQAYAYQVDAIRAVKDLSYAAIFHEQGLGKTKIAIDLFLLWLESDVVDTVFIITKKSLVENWRNEVKDHCHITPHTLSSNRAQNSASLNSPVLVYVTNYETIAANVELIKLFLHTCRVGCILDESQKIKNPDADLTRTFHEVATLFDRRVIMTGTPAANRPYDIWAQIKFLDDGEALGGSFDSFRQEMDLPKCNNLYDYGGRLSTIYERIAPFTVRETKDTAGIHLPEKTIVTRCVQLPGWQMDRYTAYRDELAYEYEKEGIIETDNVDSILKRLLRLVQCASNPALIDGNYENEPAKFPVLTEMCREFTRESKVIVWTGFIDNVNWLAEKLSEFKPVIIHGGLPIQQRNEAVSSFINSTNLVLIATPGAAKEGLTLTVANHAIFFDRSFSLDDYLQAQDRIHRISQKRDCFIHNLIADDTIDEWVDVLLTAKYRAAQLAQGDIGAETFQSTFRTDVSEVLQGVLFPNRSDKNHLS